MQKLKISESSQEVEELRDASAKAASFSYSPYSKFPVGSILITKDDVMISGTNIENSSYSLVNCAERLAIGKAVSEGHTKFKTISVYTPNDRLIPPCGACLQVIKEFCSLDLTIYLFNDSDDYIEATLATFLPNPFEKEFLTS